MEKLLERRKAATSRPACVVRRQLAFSALLWSPDGKRISYERPQDRSAAVRPAIEKLGGRIERFWLCFGEYDVVGIVEMPNNVSAAAFAIAVGRTAGTNACADPVAAALSRGDGEAVQITSWSGRRWRPSGCQPCRRCCEFPGCRRRERTASCMLPSTAGWSRWSRY